MNFLNHLPKEPSAPATLTNTQQLVKEWRGNKIYNDTTATGTDAAVAALKTFPNCVLIAGGQFDNFNNLLLKLKKDLQPGESVIFSPGAKSFNLFSNEFDRGRQFNKAVNRIFRYPLV